MYFGLSKQNPVEVFDFGQKPGCALAFRAILAKNRYRLKQRKIKNQTINEIIVTAVFFTMTSTLHACGNVFDPRQ